jgi:hypothetical protein
MVQIETLNWNGMQNRGFFFKKNCSNEMERGVQNYKN